MSEGIPLQQASTEPISAIAEQLADIAIQLRGSIGIEGDIPSTVDNLHTVDKPPKSRDQLLSIARKLYDQRQRRCATIGCPELFGEPAWDILLDLYIAFAQGKRVSVSSACIGSNSPPTTGLRWLGILQSEGLILRESDLQDNRRINVRLSEEGVERMERYLAELCS